MSTAGRREWACLRARCQRLDFALRFELARAQTAEPELEESALSCRPNLSSNPKLERTERRLDSGRKVWRQKRQGTRPTKGSSAKRMRKGASDDGQGGLRKAWRLRSLLSSSKITRCLDSILPLSDANC